MSVGAQRKIWLAEATPRDPGVGAVTLRVGTQAYITEPEDAPANARFIHLLDGPPRLERKLPPGLRGGIATANNGALAIALAAPSAAWPFLAWAGHDVTIWTIRPGQAWASRVQVFAGLCGQPAVRGRKLIVPLQSNLGRLNKPLQDNLFGGTGGWDGPVDLQGKALPVAYGEVPNIEPVLVDPANRRGVFHDGAVQAVTAAYSGGASGAGVTNDLSLGRTTKTTALGNLPFTLDVQGDALGAVYVNSHARILRRILEERSSLTTALLDTAAFDALHTAEPGAMGLFAPDGPRLDAVVDRILQSVDAWLDEGLDGKLTCGLIAAPTGTPDAWLDQRDLVGGDLDLIEVLPPVWELKVDYQPNWRPLSRSEMAGSIVDTATESFFAQPWRRVTAADAAVLTDWPEAPSAGPLPSLFINAVDAQALADRRHAIRKVARYRYRFTALASGQSDLSGLFTGNVVQLSHPDLETPAGEKLRISGIKKPRGGSSVTIEAWR